MSPKRLTPPADLAAQLAAHRAHVSDDGRAGIPIEGRPVDPAGLAAAGIEVGVSYVVNADGTLTATDPGQGGRRTADAPGRLTR